MLKAADVMTTTVVSVSPDTSIEDIARLLCDHHISGVPVIVEGKRLVGIVSEGDLIGHIQVAGEPYRSWWSILLSDPAMLAQQYTRSHGRTAGDVMSKGVITVTETTSVADTARALAQHRIKRVPVLRGEEVVGIITRSNLVQVLATTNVSKPMSVADSVIQKQLREELGAQPWAHVLGKNIVVENGVVHLFGLVQSDEERRALCIAAENVDGVKAVKDHLSAMSYVTYGF